MLACCYANDVSHPNLDVEYIPSNSNHVGVEVDVWKKKNYFINVWQPPVK